MAGGAQGIFLGSCEAGLFVHEFKSHWELFFGDTRSVGESAKLQSPRLITVEGSKRQCARVFVGCVQWHLCIFAHAAVGGPGRRHSAFSHNLKNLFGPQRDNTFLPPVFC